MAKAKLMGFLGHTFNYAAMTTEELMSEFAAIHEQARALKRAHSSTISGVVVAGSRIHARPPGHSRTDSLHLWGSFSRYCISAKTDLHSKYPPQFHGFAAVNRD